MQIDTKIDELTRIAFPIVKLQPILPIGFVTGRIDNRLNESLPVTLTNASILCCGRLSSNSSHTRFTGDHIIKSS